MRGRSARLPFARVHYPGGRAASFSAEAVSAEAGAGRELFAAAAELIDVAR